MSSERVGPTNCNSDSLAPQADNWGSSVPSPGSGLGRDLGPGSSLAAYLDPVVAPAPSRLSFSVDVSTFNALIAAHAHCKDKKGAITYLNEMLQMGLTATVATYNSVIAAQSECKDYYGAVHYFEEMRERSLIPDVTTYNSVIAAHEGNPDTAEAAWYLELLKDCGLTPDETTYNNLIRVFVHVKDRYGAARYLEEMKKLGLTPTVVTYSLVVEVYSECKDVDKVESYLQEMEKAGCTPGEATFNAVISMYASVDRFDQVDLILYQMAAVGVLATLTTYNIVISALGKNGRGDEAKRYLKQMKMNRIEPDEVTYCAVIEAFSQRHDETHKELAVQYLNEMLGRGLAHSESAYHFVVAVHVKNADKDRAVHYFEQMKVPSAATYNLIIDVHAQNMNMRGVVHYFEEMDRQGLQPNKPTYLSVIKSLKRIGDEYGYLRVSQEFKNFKDASFSIRNISSEFFLSFLLREASSIFETFMDAVVRTVAAEHIGWEETWFLNLKGSVGMTVRLTEDREFDTNAITKILLKYFVRVFLPRSSYRDDDNGAEVLRNGINHILYVRNLAVHGRCLSNEQMFSCMLVLNDVMSAFKQVPISEECLTAWNKLPSINDLASSVCALAVDDELPVAIEEGQLAWIVIDQIVKKLEEILNPYVKPALEGPASEWYDSLQMICRLLRDERKRKTYKEKTEELGLLTRDQIITMESNQSEKRSFLEIARTDFGLTRDVLISIQIEVGEGKNAKLQSRWPTYSS